MRRSHNDSPGAIANATWSIGMVALYALILLFVPTSVASAACAVSNWVDGVPIFETDCRRGTARKSKRASYRAGRSAPLRDLREGSIPYRSELMREAINAAINRYQVVVARGGWPKIRKGRYLRPGTSDSRLPQLRKRLIITGDLHPRAGSNSFDYSDMVVSAVKRFQARHGLRSNGVIGTRTFAHLNVSAAERLQQLRVNRRRMDQLLARPRDRRYVLVNIPSYELEAVEGLDVVQRHRVIVGKQDRQTPTLDVKIRGLNFFPFWRVPDSIAHRDLIPQLLKEPDYLDKKHIRVLERFGGPEVDPALVDWTSEAAKKLKFRQDPGQQNALGLVRIDMPNEHIVYMHDTPMKQLFNQRGRSYSAGCVRVQNVFDLVKWIASGEPGWDSDRVDEVLAVGLAENLKLKTAIPVYFTYFTAWVDPSGQVQFRYDLYGRDGEADAVAMMPEATKTTDNPNLLSP